MAEKHEPLFGQGVDLRKVAEVRLGEELLSYGDNGHEARMTALKIYGKMPRNIVIMSP